MSSLDGNSGERGGAAGVEPAIRAKSGTEDLLIDGLVEGRIHLDERKLTVGATRRSQRTSRRATWVVRIP